VSDIIEVIDSNCMVEDRSSFVAEATKDVESAESCHEMHVAACGVGDVLALTAQDENLEGDSMAKDSANPSLPGSLERTLRDVGPLWRAAARAGMMQQLSIHQGRS